MKWVANSPCRVNYLRKWANEQMRKSTTQQSKHKLNEQTNEKKINLHKQINNNVYFNEVNNMKRKYGNYMKRNFWHRHSMNLINLSVFINQQEVKARLDNWNSFEINISPDQHFWCCLCTFYDLNLRIELFLRWIFTKFSAFVGTNLLFNLCTLIANTEKKNNHPFLEQDPQQQFIQTQTFTL